MEIQVNNFLGGTNAAIHNVNQVYQLYRSRWIMLLLFSSISFSNAMMWITYSPIARLVMEYYSINTLTLNSMSLVYMIVYVPFVPVSAWIIDMKGLRSGLLLGK